MSVYHVRQRAKGLDEGEQSTTNPWMEILRIPSTGVNSYGRGWHRMAGNTDLARFGGGMVANGETGITRGPGLAAAAAAASEISRLALGSRHVRLFQCRSL